MSTVNINMTKELRELSEKLLQMVVSALYSDQEACVLRLLLHHNEYGDAFECCYLKNIPHSEDHSENKTRSLWSQVEEKMEERQIRYSIERLLEDGVLACKKFRDPLRPNSKTCDFYYWDREHFFFSTLYRFRQLDLKLAEVCAEGKASTNSPYWWCSNCNIRLGPADIVITQKSPACPKCRSELKIADKKSTDWRSKRSGGSGENNKSCYNVYTQFERDSKGIRVILEEIKKKYKKGERLYTLDPKAYLNGIRNKKRERKKLEESPAIINSIDSSHGPHSSAHIQHEKKAISGGALPDHFQNVNRIAKKRRMGPEENVVNVVKSSAVHSHPQPSGIKKPRGGATKNEHIVAVDALAKETPNFDPLLLATTNSSVRHQDNENGEENIDDDQEEEEAVDDGDEDQEDEEEEEEDYDDDDDGDGGEWY